MKASPKEKTKATLFPKIIFFFKSPIHIYISMLLSKAQTGGEFLQTLLPLDSTYTDNSTDFMTFLTQHNITHA